MTQMVHSQEQFALRYLPTGFSYILYYHPFRMSGTDYVEILLSPWITSGASLTEETAKKDNTTDAKAVVVGNNKERCSRCERY